MKTSILSPLLTALVVFTSAIKLVAQGTTFTYQGRLLEQGQPATGQYDLGFHLYDAPAAGTQLGVPISFTNVPVTNGLFTVELDFGSDIFTGPSRWLQLEARAMGASVWESLSPRQSLTATPYAIHAQHLDSNGIEDGSITSLKLAANAVTSGHIANGAIATDDLRNGSVNSSKIAVDSVNGSHILDGSVQADDLDLDTMQTLFWRADGNVDTLPGIHFLGTIDNQPLEFKIGGVRALRLEPNVNGAPNVIGGAPVNRANPGVVGATISGGEANEVHAAYGSVGGGAANHAGDEDDVPEVLSYAVVGGGLGNRAQGAYATIGGGRGNAAVNSHNFIGGGISNLAGGYLATVSGGINNAAMGDSSMIGGGWHNAALGQYAIVPGGLENEAQGDYSFAAGQRAKANHPGAFVWGDSTGLDLASTGPDQFVIGASGGFKLASANPSNPPHLDAWGSESLELRVNNRRMLQMQFTPDVDTTILGEDESGFSNVVNIVLGSSENWIKPGVQGATIGGGGGSSFRFDRLSQQIESFELKNHISSAMGTIGGGGANQILEDAVYATIGGGINNAASGIAATVGGGAGNAADGDYPTISGGLDNRVAGIGGTVGGGGANQILEDAAHATIGGGINNIASGYLATVGGGAGNAADSDYATISGGLGNRVAGIGGTVGGGGVLTTGTYLNSVEGVSATVPGGAGNTANGDFSFAAGFRAKAFHLGSFVWSDSSFTDFFSTNGNFVSTADNQFLVRANGGVGIGTNTPQAQLDVEQHNANFPAFRARHVSSGNVGLIGGSWYSFYAAGPGTHYAEASSARWKSKVQPISNPLGKLEKLRGVYFEWDEEHGGHHDMGMIAEEVGAVLPEIVAYETNGVDALGMEYSKLGPLLVEAIKALHEKSQKERRQLKQEWETRFQTQQNRILELERRLAEFQPVHGEL